MNMQWTLVLAFICSMAAFSLGLALGMINPQNCPKQAYKYESVEDLIKKTSLTP